MITKQTALALCQAMGYLAGKWPAIAFTSSELFFHYRYRVIMALYIITAVLSGPVYALLDSYSPLLQAVVSTGVASVPCSMIYGAMISYAEGRQATEVIVAMLSLTLVLAGGISRAISAALLNQGIAPQWLSTVTSSLGTGIALVCLCLLERAPRASAADIVKRGKRGPMPADQRMAFLLRYKFGLVLCIFSYAAVMSIRSFRDYFALELYYHALAKPPSPSTYFFADLPGAVVVCFVLASMSKISQNRQALKVMISLMIICSTGLLIATLLYQSSVISGYVWLVLCGAGIYGAYLVMGTAFYDRLLAAAGAKGTIMFLQFISDGSGWIGTVGILLFRTFGKNMDAGGQVGIGATHGNVMCTFPLVGRLAL